MTPAVFQISNPKVGALIRDHVAIRRWEVLRTSSQPLSVAQLAEACRIKPEDAQQTLDKLVDAGFAVKIPATKRRNKITYRSVAEQVVVTWDRNSPEDLRAVNEDRRQLQLRTRKAVDDFWEARARGEPLTRWLDFYLSPALTREEANEAMEIIANAARALETYANRVMQRDRASPPGLCLTEPGPGEPRRRNFLINMQMIPLLDGELPCAELTIWEVRSASHRITKLVEAPRTLLTGREYDIARRLAAGETRPAIAASLGLSTHTVATVCKRIHRKLGVRSRAELVARMQAE